MIQNLTNEQRKIISGKRITMLVSPYEAAVIEELRKHTHAKVIVNILDSIPYRIELAISVMVEQGEDFEKNIAKLSK